MRKLFYSKKRSITSTVIIIFGILLVFTSNARAIEVVISDNGTGSDNEIGVEVLQETIVEQTNEANIENVVDSDANTGENETSGNTGDDVSIKTGDVESEVVVENSINQSSVETDCCISDLDADISGNGVHSDNSVDLVVNQETNITIDQKAAVLNQIEGSANTGENTANFNSGDVTIRTGDIKVSGGILNGPINGASVRGGSGVTNLAASIAGNGVGSNNNITSSMNSVSDIALNFNASLDNDVKWNLNTGGNSAIGNLGDVNIATGDIFFDFFIKNGPVNFGFVDWGCCDDADTTDGPDGTDPDPGDDNGDPPSNPPGAGGNSDDGGGDGDGENAGGDSAGSGPQVLGLSDTSSKAAKALIFWVGIAMMIFGLKTVSSEAGLSTSKKSSK